MAHARACGLCRVEAVRAGGRRKGLLQCAQAWLPARSTRGRTSAPGLMDGACGARGRVALARKTRVRSLRSSLGLTLSGSATYWQPRESRISRATRSSSRTSTTTGGHRVGRGDRGHVPHHADRPMPVRCAASCNRSRAAMGRLAPDVCALAHTWLTLGCGTRTVPLRRGHAARARAGFCRSGEGRMHRVGAPPAAALAQGRPWRSRCVRAGGCL
jgi:hypothetical protein